MAEPEEVLIDAAHAVTTRVRRLWAHRDAAGGPPPVETLDHHTRRLLMLVEVAYAIELPIRAAQAPAHPTLLSRLIRRLPSHLIDTRVLPGTNGACLFLPPAMPGCGIAAARRYRIMALQQAGRAMRLASWRGALPGAGAVRDLFALSEAYAVDRQLAEEFPGCLADLGGIRAAAARTRPSPRRLTVAEQAVEARLQRVLAESPEATGAVPLAATPDDSLAWATDSAEAACAGETRYRGLPRDSWWGREFPPPPGALRKTEQSSDETRVNEQRVGRMVRRPEVREAEDDEDEGEPGPWMIQTDDPHEHAEDPQGLQRPADQDDDSDADDLGDSLSELSQARLVATPDPAREVLVSDDAPERHAEALMGLPSNVGVSYPEWDYKLGAYRRPGATVRPWLLEDGDPQWAAAVMRHRGALLREVRQHFEHLRPKRMWYRRQVDGDEVDIDAFVEADALRRAGGPIDDRVYAHVRPARRDIAIALLVDVSGSTDAWVNERQRIIDVEKEALLIVSEALDALGDPHAILAFSGHGPDAVRIGSIKGFEERDRAGIRGRIAALGPERYTRTGAALRHATAMLANRGETQRLLLLLSDGKPNDADRYEGRHGVEDTKQAVREARLLGMHSFCLTVDRHAPGYLPAVFGPAGYTVLRDPARLPIVLVQVLSQLIG